MTPEVPQNKSASAVPYNRTIYDTVEKSPTTDSGWGKTKNKQKTKMLYFNCGVKEGRGWIKTCSSWEN